MDTILSLSLVEKYLRSLSMIFCRRRRRHNLPLLPRSRLRISSFPKSSLFAFSLSHPLYQRVEDEGEVLL
jgi:hypothetical protein